MNLDIDDGLAEEIVASVEAGFANQVELTKELIEFSSLRGHERTAQDFMFHQMAARDLAMDRWAIQVDAIKDHRGFSPVTVDYSSIDDAEQRDDRGLVRRDAVLVAHLSVPLDHTLHSEALAPKHHLRLKQTKPGEIALVCFTPIRE